MRSRIISVLLILALSTALTGCGKKTGESGATATAGGNSGQSASDADVRSGCWKAADRVAQSSQEGNGTVAQQQWKQPPAMVIDPSKTYTATLKTNKGNIVIQFYAKDAPIAVNNFVCLAEAGYYDNTPFHRIVAGFMMQGGDPTGTGTGGPGYAFKDEPVTRNYTRGTVAMANAGPNTNGSQFFICFADVGLAKSYTIFGQVTGGMDVVDTIAKTPVKPNSSGENSSPTQPVTLEKATIAVS